MLGSNWLLLQHLANEQHRMDDDVTTLNNIFDSPSFRVKKRLMENMLSLSRLHESAQSSLARSLRTYCSEAFNLHAIHNW